MLQVAKTVFVLQVVKIPCFYGADCSTTTLCLYDASFVLSGLTFLIFDFTGVVSKCCNLQVIKCRVFILLVFVVWVILIETPCLCCR